MERPVRPLPGLTGFVSRPAFLHSPSIRQFGLAGLSGVLEVTSCLVAKGLPTSPWGRSDAFGAEKPSCRRLGWLVHRLRPNGSKSTYRDLSLEMTYKARRISKLTPSAVPSLVARGFIARNRGGYRDSRSDSGSGVPATLALFRMPVIQQPMTCPPCCRVSGRLRSVVR
jgi:hypothetical protein